MGLVDDSATWVPPILLMSSSQAAGITSSAHKVAVQFRAPRTGVIDYISWRVQSAGTSADLRISIQGISSDLPDGTPFGGSAAKVISSPVTTGYRVTQLPSPPTVTKHDELAFVIEPDTGASINMTFSFLAVSAGPGAGSNAIHRVLTYNGSAWAIANGSPQFGVSYQGVGWVPIEDCWPIEISPIANNINSGSASNEYGNTFSLPFAARCVGVRFIGTQGGAADFRLYDASGAQLASVSRAANPTATSTRVYSVYFSSAVDLVPGSYRVSVKPTSGTNVTIHDVRTQTSTDAGGVTIGGLPWGASCCQTARLDAGSWNDLSNRRIMIAPIFAGFSDGAGGSPIFILD